MGAHEFGCALIFNSQKEEQKMPKTFGGIVGFVVMAVLTVMVGLIVINRVGFLSNLAYKKAA